MTESLCRLCGEPMLEGESMFFYHGYSGPCPKPPLPVSPSSGAVLSETPCDCSCGHKYRIGRCPREDCDCTCEPSLIEARPIEGEPAASQPPTPTPRETPRAKMLTKKELAEMEAASHLRRAIDLALIAHKGQLDKNGAPYMGHVFRVMGRVATDTERTVAALHDVLEDTDTTLGDLRSWGFPHDVIRAVDRLTRRDPGPTYAEYIDAIAAKVGPVGRLARAVKIADLRDHLAPDLPRPADYDSLKPRYEKALLKLSASPLPTTTPAQSSSCTAERPCDLANVHCNAPDCAYGRHQKTKGINFTLVPAPLPTTPPGVLHANGVETAADILMSFLPNNNRSTSDADRHAARSVLKAYFQRIAWDHRDHPEAICENCGRENVTWFAPSPLWNDAVRAPQGKDYRDLMLCPVCFIRSAEQAGVRATAWRVAPADYSGPDDDPRIHTQPTPAPENLRDLPTTEQVATLALPFTDAERAEMRAKVRDAQLDGFGGNRIDFATAYLIQRYEASLCVCGAHCRSCHDAAERPDEAVDDGFWDDVSANTHGDTDQ